MGMKAPRVSSHRSAGGHGLACLRDSKEAIGWISTRVERGTGKGAVSEG